MTIELPPIGLGTYENTDPKACAESVQTALDLTERKVDFDAAPWNE